MFKVVPDQLKISDGWVRCGHCADVFDATLYLQEWVPPPVVNRAADPVPEAPTPTFASPEVDVPAEGGATGPTAAPGSVLHAVPGAAPSVAADQNAEWLADTGAAPRADLVPDLAPDLAPPAASDAAVPQTGSLPPAGARAPAAQDASDFQADLERFARTADRSVPDAVVAAEPGPTAESAPPAQPKPDRLPDEPVAVNAPDEPGFVRQARRQAFWRSPVVRAVLSVLALVLVGLMAAQWAVHERDQLAARHPQLVPLLTQMCAPLGCEIGPVRRIDAVAIDSSTLARRLGNFYAFDVVLKNNADTAVATPALELSLTDTRDQVIARRVFLPSELPGTPPQLPAQGTVPVSLRLAISDTGSLDMAGYRALLFYP